MKKLVPWCCLTLIPFFNLGILLGILNPIGFRAIYMFNLHQQAYVRIISSHASYGNNINDQLVINPTSPSYNNQSDWPMIKIRLKSIINMFYKLQLQKNIWKTWVHNSRSIHLLLNPIDKYSRFKCNCWPTNMDI